MKEYAVENGKVNLGQLEARQLSQEEYALAHQSLVIVCHDIFINYKEGLLLVKRKNFPAKEEFWPIGGRLKRGLSLEVSLRRKVLEECNLELETIRELGCARTFFKTDPFGHGNGTDTINLVYFGKGKGRLKIDALHDEPTIVTPENYSSHFKKNLHPYVQEFMDRAISLLEEEED